MRSSIFALLTAVSVAVVAVPTLRPNPATAAPASSPASREATFDVRAFGAIGDGVADDTAAFQAAVDRAAPVRGVVKVPPGRYLVGSIYLPSHVTVAGAGEESVLTLRVQPPLATKTSRVGRTPFAPGHMFLPKDMPKVASVEGVEIRDLVLLGNAERQNGGGPSPHPAMIHGIAILGGKGWVVRGVRAEDFDGDGIYLGANTLFPGAIDGHDGKIRFPGGVAPDTQPMAVGNRIENNVVRHNLRNGMMIAHGDGNILRDNLFEANQKGVVCLPLPGPDKVCGDRAAYPKYQPSAYESAELDLEPNRIKVVDGVTVLWQQVTGTLVEGNVFRDAHRLGIQIAKGRAEVSGNRFLRNTFVDNRDGAIALFVEGAHDNLFAENVFRWSTADMQRWVLRIHAGGDRNRVIGNRFEGPVPVGGHVVQIESHPLYKLTACAEFSGNVLDVPSKPEAPLVVFDRTMVDSVVYGNRFLAGGKVEIPIGNVLDEKAGAKCRAARAQP